VLEQTMDARAFKSAHYLHKQGIPTTLGKQWKPMQVVIATAKAEF
jgi:hypothetical protein